MEKKVRFLSLIDIISIYTSLKVQFFAAVPRKQAILTCVDTND